MKSRKERQRFPVAMSPLLLRQREKVRSSSPVGEKTGLDPAAAAPEKRLRSQNVEEDEIGPFLDVVVRRKLSSTCQLVTRKRSENMTRGGARGNGATKFPRATPLSRDPPLVLHITPKI